MRKIKFNAESLGAGLGLLFLYGIMYLFFHKDTATTEEINSYIQNSETVILKNFSIYDSQNLVKYHWAPWRRNNSSRYKDVAMLQSPDSKKYFSLESYGGKNLPFGIHKDILLRSSQLYIVVNKDDMRNPKLGSKEHPVVVLLWYTDAGYKFYEVPEQTYRYGVKEYLTYCRDE